MPLLVYPILSLIFRTFLLSNADALAGDGPPVYRIVYASEDGRAVMDGVMNEVVGAMDRLEVTAENQVAAGRDDSAKRSATRFRDHHWTSLRNVDRDAVLALVDSGKADVGLLIKQGDRSLAQLGRLQIIARPDRRSEAAAKYLRDSFGAFNIFIDRQRLRRAGLPSQPAIALAADQLTVQPDSVSTVASKSFSLASLVPLILVLMTITGAVYPAIDLTAGERERGTLEMLMAAPVPRSSILMSKFIAVLTVAVLTALLNLIGMAATIWTFQLDQFLPGEAAFTVSAMVKVLLLLILFAAFFSAVLLAVTSYAKSFKEAQAYLVPIILLSLGPGLMAMFPGLELAGTLAITPMMNILLLARDVIQQTVQPFPAIVAVLSTALYAGVAIWVAARTFGSASMLYSSQGSVAELFQRPEVTRTSIAPAAALGCIALLFPVNFVMIGVLGRLSTETSADLAARFTIMGAFTALAFVAIPWLVSSHQRANTVDVFGLRLPRPLYLVIGLCLGVTLWPLVAWLIELYGRLGGADAAAAWHERLVAETTELIGKIRKVSPVTIAIFLSVVPAFCEEFFFRGMLLRSLLRWRSAWLAIVITAVVFGLFHVLSNSVIALDRLLPTTLVGLVLGLLAWKSNSIWPGVLLHSLHNASVVFLGYYEPQLRQLSWFPDQSSGLPWTWLVASLLVAVACLGALMRMPVSQAVEE
jgi:membrane protease YdiL (CAAX protease family)/ABC-type Na+ efflux pump permease subunit